MFAVLGDRRKSLRMLGLLFFAGVFTVSFCDFDDLKLASSQTPSSLRATSPNLGEELSYLAR